MRFSVFKQAGSACRQARLPFPMCSATFGNAPARRILFVLFAVCVLGRSADAGTGSVAAPGGSGPTRYSAISSAVMQYRWFKFPALGVITVDVPKRRFALVGLSQLGINVFELSETDGRLACRMPGDLLARHPELVAGAAADVRHMFFDLSPPAAACRLPHPRGKATVFQLPSSGGTLEYRFDPTTGRLLEKRFATPGKFFPGSSVVWRILYEDYAGLPACPRVIRFKQRHLHYAITLFFKEMRIKS